MSFKIPFWAAALAGAPALAAAAASTCPLPHPAHAQTACYRQLLGTVSSPQYLEGSAPAAANYTIESDIVGTGFFDTYINNAELGYVGGPSGVYHTRAFPLAAGGVLVQVAGPEGSATARVYLDRIC